MNASTSPTPQSAPQLAPQPALKVAVIGAGPRGLWAAEALMERARQRGARIALTVFDRRPLAEASALGAFQAGQPETWILNAPKDILETQLGTVDPDGEFATPFPPRTAVAGHLFASWAALAEHLPPGCTVEHRRKEVTSVVPAASGAVVEGEHFAEVLLATGHADTWPGALKHTIPEAIPAYPAANLDAVGPEDVALVRGAALTFIDVARHARARVFYPVTRSGRFMEVKAYFGAFNKDFDPDLMADAEDAIRACGSLAELKGIYADLAAAVLEAAGGSAKERDIRAVLDGTDFTGDPVAELRTSLAAAEGTGAWGAPQAVGAAFRDTYDALVERASFGGRATLGGKEFDAFTRIMERVAFGPPADSARELLQLIDANRIRTDLLARGNEDIAELAREVGATVVIDAVIAPPGVVDGTLVGDLVAAGVGRRFAGTDALDVSRDGTLAGQTHIAAAGRMNEGVILGHDTLRRAEHDVVNRWADRVSRAAMADSQRVHGLPPLTPKHVPWVAELIADPVACRDLVERFGSPVNVLNPAPMEANIAELVNAGSAMGVDTRIFYARKANKALTFADTVRDTGHGVDVASENELRQVLGRGMPGERIILSAAIKPDALLRLAIDNGVVISVDSRAEFDRIAHLAERAGRTALVAPRLAPDPDTMPPTRFGERRRDWARHLAPNPAAPNAAAPNAAASSSAAPSAAPNAAAPSPHVRVVGVHAHLHGYAAADRSAALTECVQLVDVLTAAGHAPEFIDIGGGVPMRYLAHKDEWDAYQDAIAAQRAGYAAPFAWKADPLTNTYPYWQEPTRGAWLKEVLSHGVAEELSARGLRLHLEPGRSLLDACGIILARVEFVKTRADGVPLVGLAMNRTQCRTTSDDYLTDPYLVKRSPPGDELEAFLVGAYCIEDEVILRRKIRFPQGVAPGDIVAIPNAAGYFMHIQESASHQIPLAKNVVWDPAAGARLDDIDR